METSEASHDGSAGTAGRSSEHAADRLLAGIERLGAPVCVGIDPVAERLPDGLRPTCTDADTVAAAFVRFALGVCDAAAGVVPCVKFQSACFERYGAPGVAALTACVVGARERGLEVIADVKRGDIGISAEHYAAATCGAAGLDADWTTVSPYLGADGMQPFLARSGGRGRGAFALVRTSNPGGDAVQATRLADGRTVAEMVADLVQGLGAAHLGSRGWSALGAVVGATKPEDAAALRRRMPQQIFLVPGFGAQGAGPEDVRPCFDASGAGAIVTASRSVIFAEAATGTVWTDAVRDAARRLADDVGRVAGVR